MLLWIGVVLGIFILLLFVSEKFRNLFIIAHYETKYWIWGVVSMMDDIFNAKYNNYTELPNRSNEVAIVTGGSRGIGLEIVKKLLQCDMHVVIACRNVQAGLDAITKLREEGITSGSADVEKLDTASIKSVIEFAQVVQTKIDHLNILINNAGIMVVPFSLTEDGFESQLGVNYMGHFMLTHCLLPLMKETGTSSSRMPRIVNVSSCAHLPGAINFDDMNFECKVYIPSEAYAQSKLAQLMFSNILERRLKAEDAKVSSYAAHPGIVNTELFDSTFIKRFAPWAVRLLFKTPEQGSRPIVFTALSDAIEGCGGLYIANCLEGRTSKTSRDVRQQEKLMAVTMRRLKIEEFGHPRK